MHFGLLLILEVKLNAGPVPDPANLTIRYRDSKVSLLVLDGNLFDIKKADEMEGWGEYMERYTAVKRKLD